MSVSLPLKSLCCDFSIPNLSSLTLPSPSASASAVSKTNLIRNHSLQQPSGITTRVNRWKKLKPPSAAFSVPQPLDLTEDNVKQVLVDARAELGQIFDTSVGMTGTVELAELDGPFVKISLKGRFWHKRSTVVARVANYLKQRIPEILEVDIEDEKQLDDSPENF